MSRAGRARPNAHRWRSSSSANSHIICARYMYAHDHDRQPEIAMKRRWDLYSGDQTD